MYELKTIKRLLNLINNKYYVVLPKLCKVHIITIFQLLIISMSNHILNIIPVVNNLNK